MSPEVVAFFDPGQDITVQASAGATGGRCLGLPTGQNAGGSAGISDTGDGLAICPLPTANGPVFGVAAHDAAVNGKVDVLRPPKVVPIEVASPNAGVIATSAEVSVEADGRVKTRAAGQSPIGRHIGPATSAAGQYAKVVLYEPATLNLT